MSDLAVLNAAQVVTMAGPRRPRVGAEMTELSIVKGGGLLVQNGKVSAVGASAEIARSLPSGCEVVDARGRVVLPGFVDAHAHPIFGGDRLDEFEMRSAGQGYEQIAEAGGGIRSTVRKTRAATDAELEAKVLKHAEWFLECGTTTVEAKTGYGLSVEDELRLLRVLRISAQKTPIEIVPTFLGAHAFPPEYAEAHEEYVSLVIHEMLPEVAEEGLAEYCDVFCERGYFTIAQSRQILESAAQRGLGLRIHADQLSNSGAARLASELHARTADHLEHAAAGDIEAMREAGVQPVLLPGSVYNLGSDRYPSGREMIDRGLAVVLATDFNPGSSPTPSIPMVLSLASTQMRITPAEALTAVTANAAYSLDRGDQIGSLEPGKRANFTIFDCSDYRELAYYFGLVPQAQVYVRGTLVTIG